MKGIIQAIAETKNLKALIEQVETSANKADIGLSEGWDKTIEEVLYRRVEESITQQVELNQLRFHIDKKTDCENKVEILHSNNVYWDSLITCEQYQKYSRDFTKRRYAIDDVSAYTRLASTTAIAIDKIWDDSIQCVLLVIDVCNYALESISNRLKPLTNHIKEINLLTCTLMIGMIALLTYAPNTTSLAVCSLMIGIRHIVGWERQPSHTQITSSNFGIESKTLLTNKMSTKSLNTGPDQKLAMNEHRPLLEESNYPQQV